MLEVSGLKAGYGGSEVLFGLSLAIGEGEIVSLLGRNGMGKTTLLRSIMGLVRAHAGTITFRGKTISGLAPHDIARLGVAYVPQGREIFTPLTVEENLLLGSKDDKDLNWAYSLFPALKAKAEAAGGSLSGGQQQQLAIARALVMRPRLLLLDEPSEGVQPSIVAEIGATVAAVAREQGIAVLLVEQNTQLALKLSDRVAFIEHGETSASYAAHDVTASVLEQHMAL